MNKIIPVTLVTGFLGSWKKRYERVDLPHHHLVCRKCGRVEDLEVDVGIHSVEERIGREQGFKEVGHAIGFLGFVGDVLSFGLACRVVPERYWSLME